METTHYVLRKKGSGGLFLATFTGDLYEESSYVNGWENAHKGLTYDTREAAEATLEYHPEHAQALMIEEIQMEPRERPEPLPTDGPEPGTYAYTARFLAASGIMSGDEADRWKDEMKEANL